MFSKLAFSYVGFFAITSALSISALLDVQDLCAFLTIDCLLAVSVFCTPIFEQHCTCIRADLDLNVAILLDASIGIQTSSIWSDLTLAIPVALQLEIQALEPLLDLNILAFGDGLVLDLNADLSISFPAFTNPCVCPALLQAVVGGQDIVILIAWNNLNITGCDFTLLAGLRLYIISLGLNLDFSALTLGITANGGSVIVANYCSSLLCLQSLISIDLDITVELIISALGDLFCQIFTGTTTTTGAVTTTTTSSITPAPIIPPQSVSPTSTTRPPTGGQSSTNTTQPPTGGQSSTSTTPCPTIAVTTTSTSTTPAPIAPAQSITPSPTMKPTKLEKTPKPTKPEKTPKPTPKPTPRPTLRPTTLQPTTRPTLRPTTRPTTSAPITPPQEITPVPTKWSNTPAPVTPAPTWSNTPAPVFIQQATPAPVFIQQATPAPVFIQQATPAPVFLQQVTPPPTRRPNYWRL